MAFSVSKYFRLSTYLNGASAENGKVNQKETPHRGPHEQCRMKSPLKGPRKERGKFSPVDLQGRVRGLDLFFDAHWDREPLLSSEIPEEKRQRQTKRRNQRATWPR